MFYKKVSKNTKVDNTKKENCAYRSSSNSPRCTSPIGPRCFLRNFDMCRKDQVVVGVGIGGSFCVICFVC